MAQGCTAKSRDPSGSTRAPVGARRLVSAHVLQTWVPVPRTPYHRGGEDTWRLEMDHVLHDLAISRRQSAASALQQSKLLVHRSVASATTLPSARSPVTPGPGRVVTRGS